MAVRVTCINKSGGNHENPHEAITDFGWINEQTGTTGKSTLAEMVKFIDIDKGSAYVKNGINVAYCYTRQGRFYRFVQTYSDKTPTDNLLKLLECV
jgi:hypothetical protein